MDYNYSNRSYLLPEGCKDLVDVIKDVGKNRNFDVTQIDKLAHGLMVSVKKTGLQREDIQIIIEGRSLRVVCKASNVSSRESVFDVPPDYDLAKASARYFKDALCIFVPKC